MQAGIANQYSDIFGSGKAMKNNQPRKRIEPGGKAWEIVHDL
jgi:hypothetical protein